MTDDTGDGRAVARDETVADGRVVAWLTVYLKGAAMGAADTVPGVSGGTIALITGIYERLIDALTALDPRVLAELRGVHRPEGRRDLVETLREADLAFLVVLGLGVATSVVTLSRVVHAAFADYPAATYAFFLGLIAASAVVLYRQLTVAGLSALASGLAGFAIAFALSGASGGGSLGHGLPVVFVTGAIAITATVLPGVSGAFLLLLFGQYYYLIDVLRRFVDAAIAAATGGGGAGLVEGGTVVATFGVGAVVGLLTVAHAIDRALERYRTATLAFLVSLMVGSLRLPVVEIRDAVTAWTPATAAAVLVPAVVGAGAVLALDRYTSDLAYGETG